MSDRLQLRHHTTVGLVDRLVAEQLVVRALSEKDRRKVFVGITVGGENVLGRLSAVHAEQLKRMAPELIVRLKRIAEME